MERRIVTSPIAVFACCLLFSMAAGLLVYSGLSLSAGEVARGATVAVAGSLGGLLMAMAQRVTLEETSAHLNAAASEARIDQLTGLYNRSELFHQLDEAKKLAEHEKTVFGVLFLDLDRFKAINDSLGHDVGDELLRIVADRLRSATRSTDVVARLGGDEFVVIARSLMTERSVEAVARTVTKALCQPASLSGRQQDVSASVGVAIAGPGDTRSADDLVRDADLAMYKAKRDRSGYAVFDSAQRSLLTDRLEVERELRDALDLDQLAVHYQPIVNAADGTTYGLEALIRWNHPERGIVGPGFFLPIADEARLKGRIGELTLREACAQAALWNHASDGPKVRIGVNVSEQQLTGVDLPMLVSDVLGWSGLDPDQLVLEITEDVVMEHLDGLKVLRRLKGLGVHLAIDDFGTGQSSLSYIKQLDMVSTLKIDQTFVRDMHDDPANRAIIEAIVSMARALDLRVVAEGVETHQQVETLMEMGVDLMQGFLFQRPAGPDRFSDPSGAFIPVAVTDVLSAAPTR
ncbi:MAG: bifunctional diguanylate cyclase/phosphodiesterase [Actinomycetota bacterium]